MYVKTSWSTYKGTKSVSHHIVEAYRDEDGKKRDRYIANISALPDSVIHLIKQALSSDAQFVSTDEIDIETGDSLRGAGWLAVYRAWKKCDFDRILSDLTDAQRQSVFAMVAGRIMNPCSKLALSEHMADTLFGRLYAKSRLDEDELYEVMDRLYEQSESIQRKLQDRHDTPSGTLVLYDTTSTYFEGRCAEIGEHGHSKDKRWDRHQIIVGLVTDPNGLPLAVRVWPGSTHDAKTINDRIDALRQTFDIQQAVFVGDSGIYGEQQLASIAEAGYDYIVAMAWRKQKTHLIELAPRQRSLFDEQGYHEWEHDEVRYVGCHSDARQQRAATRRKRAMSQVTDELERLQDTASSGRYYHRLRLYEKVRGLLKDKGVDDLYQISVEPLEEVDSDTDKCLLALDWHLHEVALAQRKALEGKYIIETSISADDASSAEIEADYKKLQQVERGFRHIKSYLKIRPIYHRLERRIRAHVLICFLGYYLVKWLEIRFRDQGESREVERVLRQWDNLQVVHTQVDADGHQVSDYNWSRGELGEHVVEQIKDIGWWRSLDAYKRSLTKKLSAARKQAA